jgi:MFS family permease
MTSGAHTLEPPVHHGGFASGLLHRQIDHYPVGYERLMYLGLTVIATATLYYELYVTAAVNTLQLPALHMSFVFYATVIAISYFAGAFGSVAAGIVDRYGRVNFLVGGLVITGVLTLFVIPECHTKVPFAIFSCIVGFVEGICLVSTPALIRDYSPQIGRATAMGFWTMGPVLGSLIVSVVASATLNNGSYNLTAGHNATALVGATPWQHEYRICGAVGIVIAVACFLLLRELSPRLRDQVMVSMRDRALVEAKAAGIDPEAASRHPWRQMVKPDIIISALAISIFLLIYYTLVGTSVVYYETAFKSLANGATRFPINKANDLGNWQWIFLLVALLVIGWISDKLSVRKPMMVVGGIGAAIMMVVFLKQAGTAPSFSHIAVIVAALSFCLGLAYTPWMASFTETVEARNPALTANGLAVWGGIVRVVITASFLILPLVINSASKLVDHGAPTQATAAKYSAPMKANGLPAGIVGFLGAKANAPLLAYANNPANKATLASATQYSPELATLLTLQKADPSAVADLAKGAPTAADGAALTKTAQGVSALLAANAKGAPARAAEAKAVNGITLPAYASSSTAPTAAQIIASISANGATILTTATALQSSTKAQLGAADAAVVQGQLITDANQLAVITGAEALPDFQFLLAHVTEVTAASDATASQWKTWYWVCFGGIIFFLLSIPLMKGPWSPRKAKAEIAAYEAKVSQEMAALGLAQD